MVAVTQGQLVRPTDGEDLNTSGWMRRQVTKVLGAVTGHACRHPIYTLVVTALVAATTYLNVLEGSLLAASVHHSAETFAGNLDLQPFLLGSRRLRLGESSSWRWHVDDQSNVDDQQIAPHFALVTLVFPAPPAESTVPFIEAIIPESVTALPVTQTSNVFASLSNEISLAFQVPYSQLANFLQAVEYISEAQDGGCLDSPPNTWAMKHPRRENGHISLGQWLRDSWVSFLDRARHAETVALVIILLGYVAMNLTLLSLFSAMRRLGSRFWLAASVLLSGAFAFFFALAVTAACGVPISMLLLSEGIPFLVLTVGFEKSIRLTRAVLHAQQNTAPGNGGGRQMIPHAIQAAINREGWPIVRYYAIEIGILAAGAASRPREGFGHFCFLAAWTLFFDAVLLFTFYATILCVKLEVTRIRRHYNQRHDVPQNGSPRSSTKQRLGADNQKADAPVNDEEQLASRIFGYKIKPANVATFKFLMVGSFVLVNVLQLSSFWYRIMGGFVTNALAPTPVSPFKVAANGLNDIYVSARASGVETRVTVLSPIRYAVQLPELSRADPAGGQVLEGVLAGLESPLIRSWLIAALVLSLILNNYLINAARWNVSEPEVPGSKAPAGPSRSPVPRTESPKVASFTRSFEEMEALIKENKTALLSDEELVEMCLRGKIAGYSLEKALESQLTPAMTRLDAFTRAVKIRRAVAARTPSTLDVSSNLEQSKLPYQNYNYELVHGACCENVIGYLPLPLGLAGPLLIDGQMYFIPMATTEGVLVASASRGCKAINAGGGAVTVLNGDGMTRGPCVSFPSANRAAEAKQWVDSLEGKEILTEAFNSTSRFARLQTLKVAQAGTYLYIRFRTTTGDAMGMNMISKGVEKALKVMTEYGFEDMNTITLSGNFCADKKSAAVNWIEGRGKSVVAEATIPADTVRSVLKIDVDGLVELNTAKNLVGSAMAGSMGGFNAHASNLVTAVFLATGQDPAQNVESSSCITTMKNINGNLHIAVSMPSMEVGTIGGGTILEAQSAMLDLLGVRGAHLTNPGANARQLARIVAAAVLAGELSTCAALAAGHLVNAHMAHNRSNASARK